MWIQSRGFSSQIGDLAGEFEIARVVCLSQEPKKLPSKYSREDLYWNKELLLSANPSLAIKR